MLIKRAVLDAIVTGDIDLVFRRWKRPTVKTGGSLRTAVGMLDILDVTVVDEPSITDTDAHRAGFASAAELCTELGRRDEPDRRVYRVQVRPGGEDPREALRAAAQLSDDDVAELDRRLDGLDARSPTGAWTRATLRLLADHPHVRAAELAAMVGRERAPFKADVAKLKRLGLTISHSPGYELSPRGRAYLDRQALTAPPVLAQLPGFQIISTSITASERCKTPVKAGFLSLMSGSLM